jgi:hypothetical protein
MLGVCVAVIRLYQVHETGSEWRLFASAAPPRLVFDGRSYLRGPHVPSIPPGESRHGRTPGGGSIFADQDSRTDTVVFVASGSQIFDYALQGGP